MEGQKHLLSIFSIHFQLFFSALHSRYQYSCCVEKGPREQTKAEVRPNYPTDQTTNPKILEMHQRNIDEKKSTASMQVHDFCLEGFAVHIVFVEDFL